MNVLLENDRVVLYGQAVGPFAMNEMLIGCKRTRTAALIDSGAEPDAFMTIADNATLTITHLLQTHAHIDHVAGLAATKRLLPLPLYLHPDDLPVYESVPTQGKMFGFPVEALPPIDHLMQDDEIIRLGELSFRVMHTPGHSPGHVCLYEEKERILIGGDLLFRQSIGRTDLPLSDGRAMIESLRRVMTLDDDVMVFPGHMEPTTIGYERRMNPFLRGL